MLHIDLTGYDIHVDDICHNPAPAYFYEHAIRHDPRTCIAANGALVAYSGSKTGRSPKDKRIVRRLESENDIWWSGVNMAQTPRSFEVNRERAKDWLNTRKRLYCIDGYAGWDPQYQIKVRVICSRPYHAMFMHNLLIRPPHDELREFGEPDYVIYNAGEFPANRLTEGMTSNTSVDISFETGEVVVLGTEYAGEMKKAVFTIMNYLMPKRGILSMHCSATADRLSGSSSLLFGLSGTGKTTLSADPKRQLIGDDEHCWTDQGVFNIEGGCYAKAINVSVESEPDIFQALRFGAVLENVVLDDDRNPDFHDHSITENTRGAYPIEFIRNARIPCVAGHPSDVIFLTCDAFGVLPPVSRLSAAQAEYHYMSGYTAKVAGTEVGVTEPQATFSPCFGGPFLVWHPAKYAELLADKMLQHQSRVWLVNTGWSGGRYGSGARMKLAVTRSIVDAIHNGSLANQPTVRDPVFGFDVVAHCPGISPEILIPRNTWSDAAAYDATARKLAGLFSDNFKQYEANATQEVKAAGPKI
jgi:phosphoenolpyruvate carboxykinase (ATP)